MHDMACMSRKARHARKSETEGARKSEGIGGILSNAACGESSKGAIELENDTIEFGIFVVWLTAAHCVRLRGGSRP